MYVRVFGFQSCMLHWSLDLSRLEPSQLAPGTSSETMSVVPDAEWKAARLALLEKEKAFVRAKVYIVDMIDWIRHYSYNCRTQDELAKQLQSLPARDISDYTLSTSAGKRAISFTFCPILQHWIHM